MLWKKLSARDRCCSAVDAMADEEAKCIMTLVVLFFSNPYEG
jgi:hypothetical protein